MTYQKGFTLIEILVVVSILIIILSFGMSIDLSVFKNNNFEGEKSKIISLLQKARSRAMSNMFDEAHGVCYIAPNYIIFRDTCDGAFTELFPANPNMAITFPTIVFSRLTGNANDAVIHITDGIKEADIIINNEGTINW